nr:unnamed protein product [Callosobruchus analis]
MPCGCAANRAAKLADVQVALWQKYDRGQTRLLGRPRRFETLHLQLVQLLERYVPKPKSQQEVEQKSPSSVQFAEKPPSDGFEVLHDKAKLAKKGTDWENITPCPSFSSRSQSQTQWQQQRSQMPAPQQQNAMTPNVSYVQCNRRSQQKITQGVAPQKSEPQQPWSRAYAFIGQLPTDSQWSSPQNKKAPCRHCLLHGSATPRDAFNQGFVGQLPTDDQWASKRQQGPSATPREAFNTGFLAFIGQLPTDNQARPQAASRRPSTQRDVFNEAFIGQLPTDKPQVPSGRMAPPTATPREVFNQGFIGQLPTDDRMRPQTVCRGGTPKATPREAFNQGFTGQLPTDGQWGNKVNTLQVRSVRDIAPPPPGSDVFNEAFIGQLPTDRQAPSGRKPPTPNDYQSKSRPPCGTKSRDPFNEAFIGKPPTDYQSSSRPPTREKPRDPFNEAFIGQLPTDNQSRSMPPCVQSRSYSSPRDAFNTGFRGQLPRDNQWNVRSTAGPKAAPPSTSRDVFNQGFIGQLPTDARSPPGASKMTGQAGYGNANPGQSNPRQRPCGRC